MELPEEMPEDVSLHTVSSIYSDRSYVDEDFEEVKDLEI